MRRSERAERTGMCLNESPSKKEGKFRALLGAFGKTVASMKALPKRKGNDDPDELDAIDTLPQ